MESPSSSYAPPRMDASRPSIGFPLGTALLLMVIFSLSGIFSCCYHWEKIRSLRRSTSGDPDLEAHSHHPPSKPKSPYMKSYGNKSQSLPVLMPGDHIPKFIALPCPRQPPRPEKIIVEVQRPEKIIVEVPRPPPRPPRIAVPLY